MKSLSHVHLFSSKGALIINGVYSRINSKKSLDSGPGNVSKPRLVSNFGKFAKLCARKPVCFCSHRGGDAGVCPPTCQLQSVTEGGEP